MNKDKPLVIGMIMGSWIGGGVESVIMNYYRHIDRTKIQFDFICDDTSTNIPYDEIKSLGGNVIICPSYTKIFKYQKFLINLFKEKKYKIVHSNINSLSLFSLHAAYKAGVKIRIAHSHSTSNPKEWKKNLIKNILRPFSKKYANVYFACSELAGRWLFGDKTFDEGKVTIINNAIDLDKFKYNKDIRTKLRKELNIKDSTLVIGHIGRFVKQKNHDYLIDIFNEVHKKNKDSVLLLIGQGPLKDSIETKVKELNLEDYVIFTGQVSNAEDYYNAMDMFVLPSLYEGLPVVGVEAQANGLLCEFSSSMTKETKVLDTTRFISLDKSPSEWADTILKDYKDFQRKDSCEEMTKKNFNIEKEAGKLEKLYLKYFTDLKQETAAVVVAYNINCDELLNNINSYINYVDKVIIVDNSDKDYGLSKLSNDKIIYISLNGNKGIGNALNAGIKYAIDNNYKYVLTMDQDSKFQNNLLDIYEDYIDDSIGIYSPVYLIDRKRKKNYKNKIDELYWTMTSGNLLNLDAYKNIGKFNERFFIDGVDYEYCIRLRKQGYKVVRCNDAKLTHNPGITKEKKILFYNYKYGYMSKIRLYYQVRNLKYIEKEYRSFKAWCVVVMKWLKIVLLFDDKKEYLRYYRKALNDYKNNKFGEITHG